jgi:ACR3 family arsenite efflux pump ArsB
MWKGRMFERFFVWLILLELIKLGVTTRIRIDQPTKPKLFSVLIVLLLPTIYGIISNYFGLNTAVFEWSKQQGVYWQRALKVLQLQSSTLRLQAASQ